MFGLGVKVWPMLASSEPSKRVTLEMFGVFHLKLKVVIASMSWSTQSVSFYLSKLWSFKLRRKIVSVMKYNYLNDLSIF